MESYNTIRGFLGGDFLDANGCYCSIQESSVARCEEDDGTVSDGYLWLGMDKDSNGELLGKEIISHDGSTVKLGARMHLTQTHVKELLPLLAYFAEHGNLPELPDDDND